MKLKLINDNEQLIATDELTIFLIRDIWNDWWNYKTFRLRATQ